MFIIALDQGDYYQERGGNDWGRCGKSRATTFDSRAEAEQVAAVLAPFGATVVEID